MDIFLSFMVHLFGLALGFYMCSILIPLPKKSDEVDDILFEYEYVIELEELIDSNVEESPIDKSNIIKMEVPLNTVIMYYDPELKAFCYYTRGDVIYKYLNVVARKYVIDYNCPSLYKEDCSKLLVQDTIESEGPFLKKVERPILEKNINKFILKGSLEDYNIVLPQVKDLDYLTYLTFSRS